MKFLNYVVKDRYTGTNYALFINDGIFGWEETSAVSSPDPVLVDSITNLNYTFFIQDNYSGQEVTNSNARPCILYDTTLNVYWNLYFTDGIFSYDLTKPPSVGGSHGFYPLEHYYRFLMNAYNIELAWTAIGKKRIKKKKYIVAKGFKRKSGEYLGTLKGLKRVSKNLNLESVGKRRLMRDHDLTANGNKRISRHYQIESIGTKFIRNKEYAFNGNGTRDLTSILASLDII